MRPSSLTTRLILSAGAWMVVALLATGFVLSSLYRNTVENAFDERLDVFVKGLIAELEFGEDGSLRVARGLPEPRFNFPLSRWYWQIQTAGADGEGEVLVSPSLLDRRLDIPALVGGADQMTFYATGPDGEELRVAGRQISFSSRSAPLVFLVAGDATEIGVAAREFNGALLLALSLLGAGLLAAAFLQVHYGLRPLRELREALQRIRGGHGTRLTGTYPREIAPLSDEVNALIAANEEVLERARTHVGNLAHALKTPLSVLTNEAASDGGGRLSAKVEEQVGVMREQVDRHLDRARVAARANVIGVATDVAPVVAAIVRTLQKIHGERAITVTVACDDGVRFRGERQDLEEMVGNLLDNAFKWADREIGVRVVRANAEDSETIAISVDDDGPGLSEAECSAVIQRGRRLDESKPGSGLGLSIVSDIAAMYRGAFELKPAALGGLSARLELPALAPS